MMSACLQVQAGQPELLALEKTLKDAMVPAGTAREVNIDWQPCIL